MTFPFSSPGDAGPALVVTTCQKAEVALIGRAEQLAMELNALYWPRRNVTVNRVLSECHAHRLVILHPNRWVLQDVETDTVYAYHPNMVIVRGLNLVRGQRDLFAEASQLGPGDTILDCTLGFGAEAILASFLVGETGSVVGLESVPELAAVTREGLKTFPLQTKVLEQAMRRVHVVTADYRTYLTQCASRSFDVIYFDPFFGERLSGSEHSVSPLEVFGNSAPLDATAILEARRVAKRRVILKHPMWERIPELLEPYVTQTVSTRKGRLDYSVFEVECLSD